MDLVQDRAAPRAATNVLDMDAYLATWRGETVWYCPNPGNAGDSVIAAATFQLFEKHGIAWHCIPWDTRQDLSGRVVMYAGGGNFVKAYRHARTFIERHHAAAKRLVLLPHTIQGHDDLLPHLGANVDLICREEVSYAYAREQAREAQVLRAHDMALHLDVGALLAEPSPGWLSLGARSALRYVLGRRTRDEVPPFRRVGRCARDLVQHRRQRRPTPPGEPRVLRAFRTDREKTGIDLPGDNIDISYTFSFGTAPRALADLSTQALLRFIDAYDAVATNRLHVCVSAALLGKPVDFYANSYYKNRAVYEMSLAERFPQIGWHGAS